MYGINLATLSLISAAAALPAARPAMIAERAIADQYRGFWGDGSIEAGWPSQDAWGSWDELWSVNSALMKQTCGWNNYGVENSDEEIANINNAISQVSGETGVDKRFILAVVMQESKGCVRATTSYNGVVNPGLMQSHNGSGTCAGVSPCPAEMILQMIRDGTAGTQHGDGLKQTHEKTVALLGDNSRAWYAAARMYNSGSVDYSNLNNGLGSTACYAQDIANRLTGWTLASSGCWA